MRPILQGKQHHHKRRMTQDQLSGNPMTFPTISLEAGSRAGDTADNNENYDAEVDGIASKSRQSVQSFHQGHQRQNIQTVSDEPGSYIRS